MTSQKMKVFTFVTVILLTIMFTGLASAADNTGINNTIVSDSSQHVTSQAVSMSVDVQDNTSNVGAHENNTVKNTDKKVIKETGEDEKQEITKTTDEDNKNIKSDSTEKYNTTLTLDDLTGTYTVNTPINIRGHIEVPGSTDLKNFGIQIYMDGAEEERVYTYESGTFEYNYTPTDFGIHRVWAKFDGGGPYLASESSVKIFKVMYNFSINLNDVQNSFIGDEVTVEGQLTGSGLGSLDQENFLYLYENDVVVASYPLDDTPKTFTIKYNPTTIGNKKLVAKFTGDQDYVDSVSNEVTFHVYYNTTLILDSMDENLTIPNQITITGNASAQDGANLEGVTIDVYLDDVEVDEVIVGDGGIINYSFTPILAGNHTVCLKYNGNDSYAPAISNVQSFMAYYNTSITLDEFEPGYIQGSNVTIAGKITQTSTSITRFHIDLYVNGEKQDDLIISGESGYFEIFLVLDVVDDYNISVGFAGSDEYLPCMSENQTMKVRYMPQLELHPVAYPNMIMLLAEINHNGSDLISEVPLNVYVDGEKVTQQMTEKGQIIYYQHPLNEGNHEVYVEFEGDDIYLPCITDTQVVFVKYYTTLTLDNLTDKYVISKPIILKGKINSTENTTYENFLIDIYENNQKIGSVYAFENGSYEYQYIPIRQGEHKFYVGYAGNDYQFVCHSEERIIEVYRYVCIKFEDMNDSYLVQTPLKLEGTVSTADNSSCESIELDLYINNVKVNTPLVVTNGTFEYEFTLNMSGNYTIYAQYAGNATDVPTVSDNVTFMAVYNTSLVLNNLTDTYLVGSPITIEGYVRSPDSPSLLNFPIDIIVNDVKVGRVFSAESGYFEYTFTPSWYGNYTVLAEFVGGGAYLGSISNNVTFNAYKNTTITLDELNTTYIVGNPIEIEGHITAPGDSEYGGFNIDIYVNDEKVDREFTPESGWFGYTFTPTSAGNYTIRAEFVGGPHYLASNSSIQTVGVYYNTSIMLDNLSGNYSVQTPMSISGQLTSPGTTIYTGLRVNFYVNDEMVDYEYVAETGWFEHVYTPTNIGNYTVRAEFEGVAGYLAAVSENKTFTVKSNTTLKLYNLDDVYNSTSPVAIVADLSATVSDDLEGLPIDVYVDDVKVGQAATDIYGMIRYNYTPTHTANYTVKVVFDGNDQFYSSTADGTLMVVIPVKLEVNPVEEITLGQTALVTGKLTDDNNNPIIGQTIELTLDEAVVDTITTGDDGTFSFDVTPTQAGTQTYKVKYQDTTKEVNITVNEDTTPILAVDSITTSMGEVINVTAKIMAGTNIMTDINAGKVVFKVNGKTLKDANGKVIYAKVVNGTAIIENYVVPDTWNDDAVIEAAYTGNKQYTALKSEKTNITITTNPTLTIAPIESTTHGSTIKLTANITDGNNVINKGKVVFKINGKTVKDANGKVIYAKVVNNTVSVDYIIPDDFKAGNYTVSAVFIASGYDKLEATQTLVVTS